MSTATQPTTLAELVRANRERKELSRHALGELTGTSLSSLNRLELDNAPTLAVSLFRISDVLELDLQTVKELTLKADAERRAKRTDPAAD